MNNEDAKPDADTLADFARALADDLNTPTALGVVMSYIGKVNTVLAGEDQVTQEQIDVIRATLRSVDHVLGVIEPLSSQLASEDVPKAVLDLAQQREQARKAKDFQEADKFRRMIEEEGFVVEDTASGPRVYLAR